MTKLKDAIYEQLDQFHLHDAHHGDGSDMYAAHTVQEDDIEYLKKLIDQLYAEIEILHKQNIDALIKCGEDEYLMYEGARIDLAQLLALEKKE